MMTLNDVSRFQLGKNLGLGLVSLSSLAMLACAPQNSRLVSPSVAPVTVTDSFELNRAAISAPKVDVLFVIDTSESMTSHQENLKKNVDRFVEAFDANKSVDFHIGVASIFDSRRFGPVVPAGKFYPLGLLRPLKDPAHPGQPVPGPQFVTRTDGYASILGASLQVGIEPRCGDVRDANGHRGCAVDAGGPEFEDSFSPVMAALNGQNAGFYRPDAKLAVIFITDANDDSPYTPEALSKALTDLKGGNSSKISTYGVLALGTCSHDPDGGPKRITDFIKNPGNYFNLCDPDFGDQLAIVGKQIQQSVAKTVLQLSVPASFGSIQVQYGNQLIPWGGQYGWVLGTGRNRIEISGEALSKLNGPPGTKLSITYVQNDSRNLGTQHVKAVH